MVSVDVQCMVETVFKYFTANSWWKKPKKLNIATQEEVYIFLIHHPITQKVYAFTYLSHVTLIYKYIEYSFPT
jgi:hypothetical protein